MQFLSKVYDLCRRIFNNGGGFKGNLHLSQPEFESHLEKAFQ